MKEMESMLQLVKRGSRAKRKAARHLARGVTLVEVLIVVAIMAVIAGGATLLVFPQYKKARIDNAVIGAGVIKQAAELYMNIDAVDESCPTVKDLVTAKKIDGQKTDDPWGKPYRIVCEDGDIRVWSSGNDRQDGTPDDVRDNFKPSDVKRVAEL
jgi:general secretion pathway protein G